MNSRDQSLRSAQDTLFSHARSCPAFVLWDESRGAPLAHHLSDRPEDFVVRLKHPDFRMHPRFAPVLVRLTGAHDPLLDASLALAHEQVSDPAIRARHIGGWIFDRREPPDLATHLSERLTLRHPAGTAKLRFHDPRVVAQLKHILAPEQLGWLASGLRGWWYMDEGAQLQRLHSQEPQGLRTLRVSEPQWRALQRSATVNEVIRTLRMLGAGYCSTWMKQAHALLEEAAERGHPEEIDQVAYAVHALYVHPHFDTHPAVQRALEAARASEAGFCVAVAGLDEAALAGIAQDLASSHNDLRKGLRAR